MENLSAKTPKKDQQRHVWLIGGQSNAQRGFSFYQSIFQKKWDNHQLKHLKLVKFGRGGSPIEYWTPGQDGFIKAKSMIDSVGGEKIAGIIWYQGETNARIDFGYENFKANTQRLFKDFRKWSSKPDLPIILVQLANHENPKPIHHKRTDSTWSAVRELQRQIAREDSNVYLRPAHDLPLKDHAHLNKQGYRKLAHRLANVTLAWHLQEAIPEGPRFKKAYFLDPKRKKILIQYTEVNGALKLNPKEHGFSFGTMGMLDTITNQKSLIRSIKVLNDSSLILKTRKKIPAEATLYYLAGRRPKVEKPLKDGNGLLAEAFSEQRIFELTESH